MGVRWYGCVLAAFAGLALAAPASALAAPPMITDAASCEAAIPGAVWSGGQCFIPPGSSVTLDTQVDVGAGVYLTNDGSLTIAAGAGITNAGGTVTNNGSIVLDGSLGNDVGTGNATINNYGSITVNGSLGSGCRWAPTYVGEPFPYCTIANAGSGSIDVASGASLSSDCGVSAICYLRSLGSIDNAGNLTVECTQADECTNILENDGDLHNAAAGILQILWGSALQNGDPFTGAGTLENDGEIGVTDVPNSPYKGNSFVNFTTFTNNNYMSVTAPAIASNAGWFYNYGTLAGSAAFDNGEPHLYNECGATLLIDVTGVPAVDVPCTMDATSETITPASVTITPARWSDMLFNGIEFTITVTDTTTPIDTAPDGTVSLSDGGAGGTFADDVGDPFNSCSPSNSGDDGYGYLVPTSGTTSQCRVLYFPQGDLPSKPIVIIATYQGDATHTANGGAVSVMVVQATPPTITASATSNGSAYTSGTWTNHDVVVQFDCNALAGVASLTPDQTVSTEGADQSVTGTCTDTAGSSASATFSGIDIDKTPPVVSYSGDAGSYTVDQQVAITCSASDALSGLASNTCQNVSGPAYTFPLGTNTFSAGATDNAGNSASASTSFTVAVTPTSLGNLGLQFVQGSARYQALSANQQAVVERLADVATRAAARILPDLKPAQKTAFLRAYQAAVAHLARDGWLSQSQAGTLTQLAAGL